MDFVPHGKFESALSGLISMNLKQPHHITEGLATLCKDECGGGRRKLSGRYMTYRAKGAPSMARKNCFIVLLRSKRNYSIHYLIGD